MSDKSIRLPAELERFLLSQVKKGIHRSRESTIIAAVAGECRRAEQLAWLKHEIQKGVDDLIQGRVVPFDPEDIKRRGRARLAARKKRAGRRGGKKAG